ncbi:MAG: AarF/UbiB family protein [Rikenellaceae bacterium]
MGIVNVYMDILKVRRATQIMFVVMKHSVRTLCNEGIYAFRSQRKIQDKIISTPERLRMTIEELGPTYVKFGQILADRPDVVSERYRHELKKLQSKADTFSSEQAVILIEKELKRPLCEVFSKFDRTPIAAASIGQVYRATLCSGEEVVVKIQRPYIENKIKIDVYLMKYLAERFIRRNPELKAFNLIGLIDEFAHNISQELDYTNEANNMKVFLSLFKDDMTVKIPKVYPLITTKKVIVIEYISGVAPNNIVEIKNKGLDPKVIVDNGANAIFKMILDFGIFHADPHAGNIILIDNNVIAFIDFGMIGVLRDREIDFLADYTVGFAKGDPELICNAVLDLCNVRFFENKENMTFDIRQILLHNFSEDALDISHFSSTLQDSINLVIKYQLQIPSGIFMLLKTLITLEKFSEELNIKIDMAKVILPYSDKIRQKRYAPRVIAKSIYRTLVEYVRLVQDAPNDISEILYKLKEGKIKHDIKLKDKDVFVKVTRQMSLRISYVILLIGLFMGSAILIVMDYELVFGLIILYSSSFLILALLVKWIFIRKNDK